MIRVENTNDFLAIELLLKKAFNNHPHSQNNEHKIVNLLRKNKALSLALVLEQNETIIGYIAFSPVLINDQDLNWWALAPLAILPEYQNQGLGEKLVNETLAYVKQKGICGCILVGEKDYYQRFGFDHVPTLCADGIPSEYLLALSFENKMPNGKVKFNPAFFECE